MLRIPLRLNQSNNVREFRYITNHFIFKQQRAYTTIFNNKKKTAAYTNIKRCIKYKTFVLPIMIRIGFQFN